MVITIGKQFDALESYCDERFCSECKIRDKYYNCKLGSIENEVEELFAIVFGLNEICEEIEKAGRSANQSAK